MTVVLKAVRDCIDEPFFVAEKEVPGVICSAVAADGRVFPAQAVEGGVLVIASMKKDESLEVTLSDQVVRSALALKTLPEESRTEVYIGGRLFAAYVHDEAFRKPYLGPILSSNGETSFTRLDLETREHPHQRSIISAVGDVNGVDFWNESGNSPAFGLERHRAYVKTEAGAACATVSADILWQNEAAAPFLDERRTFTFYNQSEACRYVDIEMTFTAAYGDVTFGATKEAGPLGIRINEALRADRGGRFVNSYGGENEAECWSKCASFCDYKGEINGRLYGIAVFDNEKNERYPTAWHIRNYGLFAANNLYFKGAVTIKAGESLTYRYRLCFYEGEQINTTDRFHSYLVFGK